MTPWLNTVKLISQAIIHSFTGAYSPGWTFGLPFRGFLITHIQTHGRTPVDEWSAHCRDLHLHRITQHINTTNIHVLSGIQTRDPSNQAATDLRLRPHGHWDWLLKLSSYLNIAVILNLWDHALYCSQAVNVNICVLGYFEILHSVLNVPLLYRGPFRAYSVAFNPRELHLYYIIGFYFMSINFQRTKLGHNETFHAGVQ
jgi:hypothetical protein